MEGKVDKNRPSIIKGHTVEDKIKSVENHLLDIYRMKNSMARPESKTIPIIIPAYGESSEITRDKIYSSFATRTIKFMGAMIAIDCQEKNKVYLELEILRESGLVDSFSKLVGNGTDDIILNNIIVFPRDIINVFMTYKPEIPDPAKNVSVTATLYGETVL